MMRKDVFVARFVEAAADSDYSRFSRLQATTPHDIEAAAEALWQHWIQKGWDRGGLLHALTEGVVFSTLLAQVKRYDDENELVSVEFEKFWDACDEQKLSAHTLSCVQDDLARSFLTRKRSDGYTVVTGQDGIWLFRFEE